MSVHTTTSTGRGEEKRREDKQGPVLKGELVGEASVSHVGVSTAVGLGVDLGEVLLEEVGIEELSADLPDAKTLHGDGDGDDDGETKERMRRGEKDSLASSFLRGMVQTWRRTWKPIPRAAVSTYSYPSGRTMGIVLSSLLLSFVLCF